MRVVNTLLADLPASSTKPITPSNIVLKWRFKLRSTQLVTRILSPFCNPLPRSASLRRYQNFSMPVSIPMRPQEAEMTNCTADSISKRSIVCSRRVACCWCARRLDAPGGNNSGLTALTLAVGVGHLKMVNRLLCAGTDVNRSAHQYMGRTPLQATVGSGHGIIVQRLLIEGADVNTPPTHNNR
jgi:hypothetical protein